MMWLRKSNRYPAEFKESSVKLALESDQSMSQTARELGVNLKLLYNWVNKYSGTNQKSYPIKTDPASEEIKRLKKELSRVILERDILKKQRRILPRTLCKIRTEHRHLYSISSMCYFLQVSCSSYYEWLNPTRTDREKEDKELTDMIKKIFAESRKIYGSRRTRSKLAQLGKFVGRNA